MQKNFEQHLTSVNILLSDDIYLEKDGNKGGDSQIPPFIEKFCNYVKFKMLSLANHKGFIHHQNYNESNEVSAFTDEQKNALDDCVLFGNSKVPKAFLRYEIEKPAIMEEFNKKVFELI